MQLMTSKVNFDGGWLALCVDLSHSTRHLRKNAIPTSCPCPGGTRCCPGIGLQNVTQGCESSCPLAKIFFIYKGCGWFVGHLKVKLAIVKIRERWFSFLQNTWKTTRIFVLLIFRWKCFFVLLMTLVNIFFSLKGWPAFYHDRVESLLHFPVILLHRCSRRSW